MAGDLSVEEHIKRVAAGNQVELVTKRVKAMTAKYQVTINIRAIQKCNKTERLRELETAMKDASFAPLYNIGEGKYQITHSLALAKQMAVLKVESVNNTELVPICQLESETGTVNFRKYKVETNGQMEDHIIVGITTSPDSLLVMNGPINDLKDDDSADRTSSHPTCAWTQVMTRNNYAYIKIADGDASSTGQRRKIQGFDFCEISPRSKGGLESKTAKCMALLWLSDGTLELYKISTNIQTPPEYDWKMAPPLKQNDNCQLLRRINLKMGVDHLLGSGETEIDFNDLDRKSLEVNESNFDGEFNDLTGQKFWSPKTIRTVKFVGASKKFSEYKFMITKQAEHQDREFFRPDKNTSYYSISVTFTKERSRANKPVVISSGKNKSPFRATLVLQNSFANGFENN